MPGSGSRQAVILVSSCRVLANIGVGKQAAVVQAKAAAQGRETPLWSRATGGNCRQYNGGQEIESVL